MVNRFEVETPFNMYIYVHLLRLIWYGLFVSILCANKFQAITATKAAVTNSFYTNIFLHTMFWCLNNTECVVFVYSLSPYYAIKYLNRSTNTAKHIQRKAIKAFFISFLFCLDIFCLYHSSASDGFGGGGEWVCLCGADSQFSYTWRNEKPSNRILCTSFDYYQQDIQAGWRAMDIYSRQM